MRIRNWMSLGNIYKHWIQHSYIKHKTINLLKNYIYSKDEGFHE